MFFRGIIKMIAITLKDRDKNKKIPNIAAWDFGFGYFNSKDWVVAKDLLAMTLPLVAIVFRFVGSFNRHPDIVRLLVTEFSQFHSNFL